MIVYIFFLYFLQGKEDIIGSIMIGGDLNENKSPLTKRNALLSILPDDEDKRHNALISKLIAQ